MWKIWLFYSGCCNTKNILKLRLCTCQWFNTFSVERYYVCCSDIVKWPVTALRCVQATGDVGGGHSVSALCPVSCMCQHVSCLSCMWSIGSQNHSPPGRLIVLQITSAEFFNLFCLADPTNVVCESFVDHRKMKRRPFVSFRFHVWQYRKSHAMWQFDQNDQRWDVDLLLLYCALTLLLECMSMPSLMATRCCHLANATELLTPVLWTMAGGWVRTLVLFFVNCGPKYTKLSLLVWECL